MNMDQLVQSLGEDLKNPSPSRNWPKQFWASWATCVIVLAVMTVALAAAFPEQIHMPEGAKGFRYWFDSVLWLGLAVASAIVAFQSSQPYNLRPAVVRLSYILSGMILGSLIAYSASDGFMADVHDELHWYRGPCGMFIFLIGTVGTVWLYHFLKRAAPLRLAFTGAWAAVSIGAIGSFFMHLVCTHESSAHAFIWHLTPVVLLLGFGLTAGKKLLRW